MIPLAVTVSTRQGPRLAVSARAQAAAWGLPWLDRPERGGLEALLELEAEALLVCGGRGWVLRDRHGEVSFSPGLSAVRVKRLERGGQGEDHLVRLAELRPGDVVLDATLGLAADAIVCARVVGETGRVIGVEGSRALYLLVSEGLSRLGRPPRSCEVEPRFGRAEEVLATLPRGSVDVVLIDPMFERPRRASAAFEVLRRFAVHEPLTPEVLAHARRVARRWVVVKAGRYGGELRRLGLEPARMHRAGPIQWARIGPLE